MDIVPVGESCVLATMTSELYDSTSGKVTCWRESCNLAYAETSLLAFASIDHVA